MTSDGERSMLTQIGWSGLPTPHVEYPFHPSRKWRFDLAWPSSKVAVEVEGGTFIAGRHSRGRSFEADCEKYAEAAIAGWRVLRVTTDMVDDGRALGFVQRALA